jgi:molybdopterin/thiamine biosynthesis adenylyltransferase
VSFVLVDPDVVERTNLNRLVGALPSDVADGRTKVEATARMIGQIRPQARIDSIVGDITDAAVASRVAGADFIFSCTDNQASRHVLNQLAYQYLVPLIDVGVAIGKADDGSMTLGAHVQMLAPGLPCLWCSNHLDAGQVRQELMTEAQRATDPYFQAGNGVPQPAVISLNGTASSVAVTMFLAAVTGIPSAPRYVSYDAVRARMNALMVTQNEQCPFCGPDSTLGWGGDAPLPGRQAHG